MVQRDAPLRFLVTLIPKKLKNAMLHFPPRTTVSVDAHHENLCQIGVLYRAHPHILQAAAAFVEKLIILDCKEVWVTCAYLMTLPAVVSCSMRDALISCTA